MTESSGGTRLRCLVTGASGYIGGRLAPALLWDFRRAEEIVPGELLRLRAEMRLPGRARLEWSVGRDGRGRTVCRQRALFRPRGLPGPAYWWSMRPFHAVVFGGMVRNITAAARTVPQRPAT